MLKLFLSFLFLLESAFGLVSPAQNWKLDGLPAFTKGHVCGTVYNAGAGLGDERHDVTDEESRMQIVSAVKADDFAAYCAEVEQAGFEKTFSSSGDGITAAAFRGNDKFYYAYYCEKNGQARFIEDNGTNCFEDFGYTYPEGAEATVYQFDYPYQGPGEKHDEDLYSTNGMMYIIRLADNRLIVIDGGSIRQSADQNIEECMAFLHRITDTAEDETVHIALWYGTHGHSDHITFFYKLLGFHHDTIDLERVMFNYPSLSLVEHDERTDMFRSRLAELYPNVKYLKPHTGMTFDIANVSFRVLYTQEDAVSPLTGKTPVRNANDGSTVCRLTIAGKRFLVLGDINILAQDRIIHMYDRESVRTDLLQAAHHLYNAVTILYDWTDAEHVLCPMSPGRARLGQPGYTSAKLFYTESQLLYADDGLYGVTFGADGLTLTKDHTNCVPYDDSSMNEIK